MKRIIVLLVLILAINLYGADVDLPYSFTANFPAVASQVNDNFTTLETAVEGIPNWVKFGNDAVFTGGNVGIGTTGPGARLHIYSPNVIPAYNVHGNFSVITSDVQAADLGGSITLGGMSNVGGIDYQRIFASIEGRKTNSNINDSAGYLSFKTSQNGGLMERMRIDNTGNVGIGTTAPETKLQIGNYSNSSEDMMIAVSSGGTSSLRFYDNNNSEGGGIKLVSGTSTTIGKMHFFSRWTSDSEKVTIDLDTGNVGIGTTSPGAKLDVAGDIRVRDSGSSTGLRIDADVGYDSVLLFEENTVNKWGIIHANTTGSLNFYKYGTGSGSKMVIDTDGNVGIGTTGPDVALDVNCYTQLGSEGPKIKMKKFTGTTAATEGQNCSNIVIGFSGSKIISATLRIYVAPYYYTGGYTYPQAGYEANIRWDDGNMNVFNHSTNSENILSKPFVITIWYEE